MDFQAAVLILLVSLGIFSFISYRKRLLSFEGVLIANIVGIAIFLLGNSLVFFFTAVIFFVVAEFWTLFHMRRKARHEIRTAGNILGNSGTAILALALGFPFGFFAAFSGALADTLSSEIGLLSKKKPLLITTMKPVEPGTDGGVTLLGISAAFLGGLIIAALHLFLYRDIILAAILVACGVFGSLADSIFGALFERQGMLNNAEVNFLGSLSGTGLAWAILVLAQI